MSQSTTNYILKEWAINRVSEVTVADGMVYKRQPKFLCDNEWWALHELRNTGFVPKARRVDDETIEMELLTDTRRDEFHPEEFKKGCARFLNSLHSIGIRHGDLTPPHVFYVEHRLVVIDWAESRHWDDPRPDKRREGDGYWMSITTGVILNAK
jgi:RIO-like serine/threonine protein kinase